MVVMVDMVAMVDMVDTMVIMVGTVDTVVTMVVMAVMVQTTMEAQVRKPCLQQERCPPVNDIFHVVNMTITQVSLAFHPDVPINSGVVTHMVGLNLECSHICVTI